MKYSIVVPIHNVEAYLRQCIETVLDQQFLDYELILVNDGSNDSSGKICDEYSILDQRVVVIHQKCQGVSAARNVALSRARGEFVIFLDADDYWLSIAALSQIDSVSEGADLIRFDYKIVQEGESDKNVPPIGSTSKLKKEYASGETFLIDALTNDPEYPWYSVMYAFKRSLWESPDKLRYPTGIRFHEDTAVIYKAILRAKKVTVISECVYAYRKRNGAVSREDSLELLKNRLSVNLEQIKSVENEKKIESTLKSLLCKNMATAFYTDLIHVNALNKTERKEIIDYLKEYESLFCKYPATKKQKLVNFSLKLLGIRNTCRVLHIRRKLKYRQSF